MGIRECLKRLQREAEQDMITELMDGTTAKFYSDEVFPSCFLHEVGRGRRHYFGEEPGPAHPMIMALRKVSEAELARIVSEQGTILEQLLGEDEIMRGLRERPGPPVRWNEEGTVCE